ISSMSDTGNVVIEEYTEIKLISAEIMDGDIYHASDSLSQS
ncbi:5595_t:CDS:2, partial [Racocetra persica]